jgi:hypothetical protein
VPDEDDIAPATPWWTLRSLKTRREQSREIYSPPSRVRRLALDELLPEMLDQGWRARPDKLTFEAYKRRRKARGDKGQMQGAGRPFPRGDEEFYQALTTHTAISYTLDTDHMSTLQELERMLKESAGQPVDGALRSIIFAASVTGLDEMMGSRSWLAFVIETACGASRPPTISSREVDVSLSSDGRAPAQAFRAIYTAVLDALDYEYSSKELAVFAWEAAAMSEGFALASCRRPGSRIPKIRHPEFGVVNPFGLHLWLRLEPMIHSTVPTVCDNAAELFIAALGRSDAFVSDAVHEAEG